MANNIPSALDLRVASGLKLMATGEDALGLTHAEVQAAGWLARARCNCGHRAFIDHVGFVRDGEGDHQLSEISGRLVCAACQSRSVVIEIVDPWRDNLEE